jgi:hypothetical protein
MSKRFSAEAGWAPWAGLAAGPFAWFLQQQVGSWANFADCSLGRSSFVLLLGVVCAIIAVFGALWSWRATRPAGNAPLDMPHAGSHRFIGILGAFMAGLFLLAVINQTMAGLFLTGCER